MSKAMHTQGPWEFLAEPGYCSQINGADGTVICCFDEDPKPADAQLMTVAPELLALAKKFQALARSGEMFIYPLGTVQKLDELIARASETAAQQKQGDE